MNSNISKIIYEMIKYNGSDAKRINHALKVYAFSKCIIESETTDERLQEITVIAAILHDIGIHVCEEIYNSSAGRYQEIEGPPVAVDILSAFDIDNDVLERVLYLIAHHHTYKDINGLDYQTLVEADFIVNLEEENSDKDTILAAIKNIFKTSAGIEIINSLLL